ncbi:MULTISPECIES: 3-hydroxyacyl-CoA dehydrogenase [Caballeronia]|uniref:3-hydroxyacyl-CoA dehydrogenase n=1 Tax=Caballeronia TaxID=1827195 RepID=UPI00158CBD92|nr:MULTISPECIES: 3-hydroxyacyl-CoA dehydrogenase [Caballeronia]MCG7404887.1 3-hydroxyacyl-CoA dehydrogenase [Caballeronia zhejiangensis]MCI1046845.1 3-hydroxyacyl-CoA dehydrogenase [Caballeronia zhejiangensis]MDR5768268.1 3-hydroxyacyl-CoA dehydrogenase [Caballeronia sp. LZ028]MDR5796914.1 3-hydroxyacyl-CoA dehydrogenase [Caballeronia sp. LZ008]
MQANNIAVIGSGRIGRAWAIVFAKSGFNVTIHDASKDMLGGAIPAIRESVEDLASFDLIDEAVDAIVARITACEHLADAVADADLVQENIAEVVEAKRALFIELDRLTKPDAILASSTSGLPASTFTEGIAGRARCLVAHPVNPPSLVPLVELCGAPWTSQDTMERARAIYEGAKQKPVTVNREISGFLLNRLQGALLDEALSLYEQGYASAADLDTVIRDGLAMRWSFMGPFETIDLNAPGGVADYAARYGGTYKSIAAGRKPFDWSAETLGKLDAERRAVLPREKIEERSRWRDRRLMALLAHRRDIEDGEA